MTELTKRRQADRERKAAARAKARLLGIPSSEHARLALVEALTWAVNSGPGGGVNIGPDGQSIPLDGALVMRCAITILVRREGYDMAHSQAALARAMAARPEHRWPSHIPTHYRAPAKAA